MFGTGANSAFWKLAIGDLPGEKIYSREDDVVAVQVRNADGWVVDAFGDPTAASAELASLIGTIDKPIETLVSREIYAALDAPTREFFGPHWGFDWDFYYATEPLADVPQTERIEKISHGSATFASYREEILATLTTANPISDAIEKFDDLDWYVMKNAEGRIMTVVGSEPGQHVTHLHGLGTHPGARGQGLGAAIMVGAINDVVSSGKLVKFGMWGWNDRARRLYARLGITHGAAITMGSPEPFPELERT